MRLKTLSKFPDTKKKYRYPVKKIPCEVCGQPTSITSTTKLCKPCYLKSDHNKGGKKQLIPSTCYNNHCKRPYQRHWWEHEKYTLCPVCKRYGRMIDSSWLDRTYMRKRNSHPVMNE